VQLDPFAKTRLLLRCLAKPGAFNAAEVDGAAVQLGPFTKLGAIDAAVVQLELSGMPASPSVRLPLTLNMALARPINHMRGFSHVPPTTGWGSASPAHQVRLWVGVAQLLQMSARVFTCYPHIPMIPVKFKY
jgi:hypothetical protein